MQQEAHLLRGLRYLQRLDYQPVLHTLKAELYPGVQRVRQAAGLELRNALKLGLRLPQQPGVQALRAAQLSPAVVQRALAEGEYAAVEPVVFIVLLRAGNDVLHPRVLVLSGLKPGEEGLQERVRLSAGLLQRPLHTAGSEGVNVFDAHGVIIAHQRLVREALRYGLGKVFPFGPPISRQAQSAVAVGAEAQLRAVVSVFRRAADSALAVDRQPHRREGGPDRVAAVIQLLHAKGLVGRADKVLPVLRVLKAPLLHGLYYGRVERGVRFRRFILRPRVCEQADRGEHAGSGGGDHRPEPGLFPAAEVFDAPLRVPAGKGGREAPAGGHTQQACGVVRPHPVAQPLQHGLVAAHLHVAARELKGQPDEGVIPVQAEGGIAQQAPERVAPAGVLPLVQQDEAALLALQGRWQIYPRPERPQDEGRVYVV